MIWAAEPSRLTPFHFGDGVSLYLAETDEKPTDDFLGQGGGAEVGLWSGSEQD